MHEQFVVHTAGVHRLLGLFHARDHARECAETAHFRHLAELHTQVFHVELALGHFGRELIRVLFFDHFGRTLDKANNVAHAQYASGNADWVKRLDCIELFTDACEFDGLAGNCAHR